MSFVYLSIGNYFLTADRRSGQDVEYFLGRKLSELESGILCEQCWDIASDFMKWDWQKETYQEPFIRLEYGLFLVIGLGISRW